MPKVVDHEERRAQIVEAYLKVVARSGHDAATSRTVAEELGMVPGGLWHYFASFTMIEQRAALRVGERTQERILLRTAGLRGLSRLKTLMHEVLPMEKETRDEAAIVVGFWGQMTRRPSLASMRRAPHEWSGEIRAALDEAIEDGELRVDTPVEDLLLLLRSITYGQQVSEVVDGPAGNPEHRLVLDTALRPWLTGGPVGS